MRNNIVRSHKLFFTPGAYYLKAGQLEIVVLIAYRDIYRHNLLECVSSYPVIAKPGKE